MKKELLLLVLLIFLSCKNNEFKPQLSTGLLNKKDVKVYHKPDSNSKKLITLSLCDPVLINKGRIIEGNVRTEEINHKGRLVKIKVREDSKRWLNINFKNTNGWILEDNIFYLEDQLITEILQSEFNNQMPLIKKYTLIDDPYKKQYIRFLSGNEAEVVTNYCEGFGKGKNQYYIYKGYIFFPENELILKINSKRELMLFWGAESFTCNNVVNGGKFLLK